MSIEPEPSVGASAVRASDEERDAVIDALSEAAGRGRITLDELETRIEGASAARTRAELAPLTADLPSTDLAPAAATGRAAATLSKVRREGYWEVPAHLDVVVTLGKAVLDFTQARLSSAVVEVVVDARLASVDIVVPAGVRVDTSGLATPLGKSEVRDLRSRPDGPLIRVTGQMSLGTVKARRMSSTEAFFRSGLEH